MHHHWGDDRTPAARPTSASQSHSLAVFRTLSRSGPVRPPPLGMRSSAFGHSDQSRSYAPLRARARGNEPEQEHLAPISCCHLHARQRN